MRKHGDISVIIPCYRCGETIERALASVLAQTLRPAEIVLIDDASPDDGETLSSLRAWGDRIADEVPEIAVQVIGLQRNVGPGGARNAGWEQASSRYLAFLDADDAWHPQKLETQYGWMSEHPECALSGHGSALAEAGPSTEETHEGEPVVRPCKLRPMLFRNALLTRSVMVQRDVPLRFVAGKRYSEDYLLWLQLLASGVQAVVLERVLAYSFKHDYGAGGLSADLWRMECGELENFRLLYKAQAIGWSVYLAASLFSLLKYLKRVVVVAGRFKR